MFATGIVIHYLAICFIQGLFKSNAYTEVPAVETSTLPNPADDKDSSDDDLTLVEADDLLFELLKVKTFKFLDLYKLASPFCAT